MRLKIIQRMIKGKTFANEGKNILNKHVVKDKRIAKIICKDKLK